MSNETVTYSLEAVLTRIEGEIDKIDERLTKVEIGLTDIKGDIKVLDEKIEGIDNRLRSVEGTQKNQVWTLIILLGSAIITAGWKVFFSSNI
ncbi:MAG: polyhydroxyalkanoate biosynthesis repressor PhaR [Microcystis sp. M058S1]|uniref:polyhydroxyalkanoate biosynthesis repressor PhaR n=1 Tax=Microcystis sp. M058S1 TaxID=2771123 RepID=UPI0025904E84|nr:polyhydroxyalkanoate biosynthesis repressor PhaR [Microcystis sp. M058S1]MCA2867382.1 polyhydroxyalkanoate biosynthesis repressor PhaR [Microcystis sp. M058S1]